MPGSFHRQYLTKPGAIGPVADNAERDLATAYIQGGRPRPRPTTVVPLGEYRPHSCYWCSARFARRRDRDAHLGTHQGTA